MQRKALGKGIRALIPLREEPPQGRVIEVPVEQLNSSRFQPRKVFNDARLEELAASIKEMGIIQPVIAQKRGKGYELIAGERRWRAAQKAGLSTVPVLLKEALSDEESIELALIENIQRENLNAIEEAKAYKRLLKEFGLTQEKVAKIVGKERSSVANTTRLLNLPLSIQDDIEDGVLTMGHARAILGVVSPKGQITLRNKIVRGGLSVRQAESLAGAAGKSEKKQTPGRRQKDVFITQYEEKMKRYLGTPASIVKNGNRGKIEIRFSSEEELERILETIMGE